MSKNFDWIGGQEIIQVTIGFVFGNNNSKKTFSTSGEKMI